MIGLFFSHIPKTAGTSVITWLQDHYHNDKIIANVSPYDLAKIPNNVVNDADLLCGHYELSVIQELYSRPNVVITFLRDPTERFISQYYFSRNIVGERNSQHFEPSVNLAKKININEFANHPQVIADYSNVHLKFLNSYGRGFSTPEFAFQPVHKVVQSAENNLKEMTFFGLVEHIDASFDMLAWILGWKPVGLGEYYENKNATKPFYNAILPESLVRINKINALDYHLYHYAESLFQKRLNAFIQRNVQAASDGQRLRMVDELVNMPYQQARIELLPSLIGKYHIKTSEIIRSREYTYTFDQPLNGAGWYPREGRRTIAELPYRWSKKTESVLDLPIKRDIPLELRFQVRAWFHNDIMVYLDDSDVPLQLERVNPFAYQTSPLILFRAVLPPWTLWRDRLTSLRFCVPYLTRPCDVDPNNPDTRSLGIAISWIQVVPYESAQPFETLMTFG